MSPGSVMKPLLAIIAGSIIVNLIFRVTVYVTLGADYFRRFWNVDPLENALLSIFMSLLTIIPAWVLGYVFSKWAKNSNRVDMFFAFLGGALGGCIAGTIIVIVGYGI